MEVVEILQASLIPIVILSAAGLITLSMQQRYGRVIDRIRYFHAEFGKDRDKKWLNIINEQLYILIRRGKLLRNSMLFLMLCILFAILTTIFLSIEIIMNISNSLVVALFFLSFIATLLALYEVFISYEAVLKEDKNVRKI